MRVTLATVGARRPLGALALLTLAFASATACAATQPDGFDGSPSGPSGSADSGAPRADAPGAAPELGGDSAASPAGDGCADAARIVYVLTDDDTLYSFDPSKLKFTSIGKLNCPESFLGGPNSMAVDRSGVAWVGYTDGTLFEVSTKDASCRATSFAVGQSGFGAFGMGFSSRAAGSNEEDLFVSDLSGGGGLATIDTKTFALTPIAPFTGELAGLPAELTGTGDGRLFGFFQTEPASLAELSKTGGAAKSVTRLDGVAASAAYAFSFWGGAFWFYTASIDPLGSSTVTRLDAAGGGAAEVVMRDIGFRIVGAGVSTCAPLKPPA